MMLDELKCPGCGKIIDQQGEAALFCPHCGTSLADKPGGKNGKKTRLIYLLAVLAAVILIIAAAIVMNGLTASRLNPDHAVFFNVGNPEADLIHMGGKHDPALTVGVYNG